MTTKVFVQLGDQLRLLQNTFRHRNGGDSVAQAVYSLEIFAKTRNALGGMLKFVLAGKTRFAAVRCWQDYDISQFAKLTKDMSSLCDTRQSSAKAIHATGLHPQRLQLSSQFVALRSCLTDGSL